MLRTGSLLLALALLAPQDAPEVAADLATRLERGRQAASGESPAAALPHLAEALELAPENAEALGLAVLASGKDPDAAALWALDWAAATADAEGRLPRRGAGVEASTAAAPGLEALEAARARAAEELAKLVADRRKRAARAPEEGLVAAWASALLGRLTDRSPALRGAHADALGVRLEVPEKHVGEVIRALERTHSRALSNAEYGVALRAARILNGLASQGGFDDLQGEPPRGLERLRRSAREALGESRRRLEAQLEEPWTIERLEELTEEEARAFTREHADPETPGRAYSPRRWYVVETTCGWETLLGVARTVELHHERLAGWFGEDPFVGVPGLVRVLPEAAGLEAEGAAYWWAGGFQGGNTTTARFSCGTIEGFGGLLTHELTHRFDGAVYPGQPSWLVEGKAVWTGGSFGASSDATFVEDHVSFGTVEGAWIKGYGGKEKLRELLEGTIEDYRDNYVAGYALYAYLKLWQEPTGTFVHAPRLEGYMKGCSSNRKRPAQWFFECFADGKEGRPAGEDEFVEAWGAFLRGFYWDDRAPWTSRYTASVERATSGWVYDAPTWSWARSRAEPYWGQDHARRAGDLFVELGRDEEAGDAYLWALTVDEPTPRRLRAWSAALERAGSGDAAWALGSAVRREALLARVPGAAGGEAPLPLPRTRALHAHLGEAAEELAAADLPRAAASLRARRGELGRWLGLEPVEPVEPGARVSPPTAEAPAGATLRPLDPPAERLGLRGWVEAGLTGYEERRAPGCWYVEPDGELHVGRFRPREGTGTLDRTSHQRHAYVHTARSEPEGRYAVSCRIQFTTSYVNGALVLGYGRRDRNVRLSFSAGDFLYAIGKKDETKEIEQVGWRIDGLRERDGPLSGSTAGGTVKFAEPRTNFELLAIVDGAAVHFWIEGDFLGSYHDATGTPIAGHIGFATGQGAIRVIDPVVRRLDRDRELRVPLPRGVDELPVDAGLDLTAPPLSSFRRFLNRPVHGLAPDPRGKLVLWVPLDEWEEARAAELRDELVTEAVEWAGRARKMLQRVDAGTPLSFALPDRLGEEAEARLLAALAEELGDHDHELLRYPWAAPDPTGLEDEEPRHRSWMLFVDSAGVLRHVDRFYGFASTLPDEVVHWVTVFRDDDARR
jgi:hypothetical protein